MTRLLLSALMVGLLMAVGHGCSSPRETTTIAKDAKPESAPRPADIPPPPKKRPV